MLTVGMAAENCFIARPEGGESAVIIDPGDEGPRLLAELEEMKVNLDAILLTHTHPDHIGAVAEVAEATGAKVWCPELEVPVLRDPNQFMSFPGMELRGHEPDETVKGGEKLKLAGLDIDVLFTPGHSPGHVTYSIPGEKALFSGDVLFQGSVGRVDLPFGDGPTLLESLRSLVENHPPETTVYPGHMGITTLGAERASNPFLVELAR